MSNIPPTADPQTPAGTLPTASAAPAPAAGTPEKVYAGKYKSPEDLERAYSELETKLGEQGTQIRTLTDLVQAGQAAPHTGAPQPLTLSKSEQELESAIEAYDPPRVRQAVAAVVQEAVQKGVQQVGGMMAPYGPIAAERVIMAKFKDEPHLDIILPDAAQALAAVAQEHWTNPQVLDAAVAFAYGKNRTAIREAERNPVRTIGSRQTEHAASGNQPEAPAEPFSEEATAKMRELGYTEEQIQQAARTREVSRRLR